ncbi:hypothetical protein JCM10212_002137 [Sporobolomyces blumeae]
MRRSSSARSTSSASTSRSLLCACVLVLFCLVTPSLAFFEHLFQQHHDSQGMGGMGGPRPGGQGGAAIAFEDQLPNVACAEYVCPGSLACVREPVDCPCPSPLVDRKCRIKGANGNRDEFVCARDCAKVEEASRV